MSNTALTNMSLGGWFSEMEADDFDFADQGLMNSPIFSPLDEFPQGIVIAEGEKLQQSSSSESCTSHPTSQKRANPNFTPNISTFGFSQNGFERPCKQIKTQSHHSSIIPKSSSNTFQISFGNTNSNSTNTDKIDLQPKPEVVPDEYINFFPWNSNKKFEAPKSRPPSRDQEHVIAERKRREKLNQQFIELAAIVPGLKKMDKASVLGDAVKYLKQLQERVKLLQEQTSRKSEERVILVNRSIIRSDHRDSSSWDENFNGEFKEALPEIEARISENNLLVRIHCEQRKGLASKFLSTIEKLHLSVVNSSFLPFGQYTMDITIVAQMDAEFRITVKDLVKNLRDVCVNDK